MWIDFSNTSQKEPSIILFLKMENEADIDQTVKKLTARIFYDVFPDNSSPMPLQSHLALENQKVKAKSSQIIGKRIAILPSTAEVFEKCMDRPEYLYWSGETTIDVSAKIWGIEIGGKIKNASIPQFPHVPSGRIWDGIRKIEII